MSDIIKNLYSTIVSDEFIDMVDEKIEPELEDKFKEYEEIINDIKLIIHETIDKINDQSVEIVDEVVKDIKQRVDLESDGHGLDKDKFKKIIDILADKLADIYADENGYARSKVDLFKYATTQMIKNKLGE